MSVDSVAADRLPWLADEPPLQAQKGGRSSPLVWAVGFAALVAAAGLWIAVKALEPRAASPVQDQRSSTTVPLPPLQPAARREVRIGPSGDVPPLPARALHRSSLREARAASRHAQGSPSRPRKYVVRPRKAASSDRVPRGLAPGPTVKDFAVPSRRSPQRLKGASGGLVQVGAFGSARQANRGWRLMVREYPAMTRLHSLVREAHNSKGLAFYRLDVRTTSQAHSEVLCQRMRKVGLSCAVVGLPRKAKIER